MLPTTAEKLQNFFGVFLQFHIGVDISFTRAAEQLYRDKDPDGCKRRKFVMEQLQALGVEITEAVLNMIEGSVWEINTETKKAQVQTKEIVSAVAGDPGEAV